MNNSILRPKHKHFLINAFCLMIGITALSVYFSLQWLQGFAYHVPVPLVLTVALLSFFGAFLLLSLIVSGVVQVICSKRITDVLQKG